MINPNSPSAIVPPREPAADAARYAVEFTIYIGQQSNKSDTEDHLGVILSSTPFGKGGYTILPGDSAHDESGAPASVPAISRTYLVNDKSEADEASEQVREFLKRVFSEMGQQSVLLRMDTVDRNSRQIVVTDDHMLEIRNVDVLTGAFLLPPEPREA